MKFNEFWDTVTRDLSSPRKIITLKQKKEFVAKFSGGIIEISPMNKQQRSIDKKGFFKVWESAKTSADLFKPSNYTNISFNSSYIVAIMKHFLKDNKIE